MFFKRKKLREIEEKIDVLQQMLERQTQEIKDMEEHNQRLLCDAFHEKTIYLAEENQNMLGAVETKLKDAETNILSALEKSVEETKQWKTLLESRNKAIEDALDAVKSDIEKEVKKERQIGEQITDKLDLAENEIRMLLINSVLDQLPQDMEAEEQLAALGINNKRGKWHDNIHSALPGRGNQEQCGKKEKSTGSSLPD